VIRAVTFDYWNTLMYEQAGAARNRRIDAWLGILEGVGFKVERERLDAVFEESWQRFVARWTANEQVRAAEAAEEIVESLGFHVPPDVRRDLVEAFATSGAHPSELHSTEGVGECLAVLKDAGVKLGIICDVGMTPSVTLRAHLAERDLLRYFDHWSFSDEVGVYKPDPVIFRHALDGLGGVEPAAAAHIGDLRRTDIAGARSMGMTAVRYTGVFDDDSLPEPEGHLVMDDHRRLPELLKVGAGHDDES
jgi:putative hydrolase of the HAD superfamily